MDNLIQIDSRDLKNLRQLDQPLELVTLKSTHPKASKKLGANTVIVIDMQAHLGYERVTSTGEMVRRTVKRLSRRQRLWTRATLAEEVLKTIGVKDGQTERAVKTAISRKLTDLYTDGQLKEVLLPAA